MSASRPRFVIREIRAQIIPQILAIPARLAQLRGMSRAEREAKSEPSEPTLASKAQPKRRRLIRDTALLAAKSLRAPIVDRKA